MMFTSENINYLRGTEGLRHHRWMAQPTSGLQPIENLYKSSTI